MEQKRPRSMEALSRSYGLGATASFLSTLITFPVHKTIFRQQLHALPLRHAVHQLHREGLGQLFRGASPPLLAKTLQGTFMYGSHESFLRLLSSHSTTPYSLGKRATAGFLAGLLEAVALCPLERLQNVLQDGRKVGRFPTTCSILREFNTYALRERAQLGYYRGLGLILTRNGMGSCLYFSFKDPLRDRLSDRCSPGWLPALVAGTVSGTGICLLLYPLSVLITHVQSQVGKQEALPFWATLAAVWGARGRQAHLLYRGGALLILRSGLAWGLTTAIHDALQRATEPPAPTLGPAV